jgi:hypothetical protein
MADSPRFIFEDKTDRCQTKVRENDAVSPFSACRLPVFENDQSTPIGDGRRSAKGMAATRCSLLSENDRGQPAIHLWKLTILFG